MAAAPQQYDPTSPTPYVAPDPTPPPKESPFQGQPAPPPQGNITHGGAAAGIFDGLLRGFVNGYAQGEQHKALTLKKKQDDLTASYNADAQRAMQVAQSQIEANGKVDPNSDDYKQAKAAVDGSWGALQEFRGGLLQQQQGKKGKKATQDRSPAEVMVDPKSTPQEKAYVLWQMSQKAGPPVYGQIQTLAARANSPQAQAAFKAQATAAQAEPVVAQNAADKANAQATYDKYAGWSSDELKKLPPEEQQKFRNAEAIIVPQPKESGTTREYMSPDGKMRKWLVPGTEPPDWSAAPTGAAAQPPKVGSFGDFMTAAYGDKPTQEQYAEGRALWAKAGAGTTVGEHVVMVPQKDGSIKPVTVETISTKEYPGTAPTARGTRQDQPAGVSTPTPGPGAATAPTRRTKAPGAGVVSEGPAVGGHLTPAQTKAEEDVLAATKLNSLAVQALQSKDPSQQRQLALALIKGMAGRINMQEYAIYTKGYGVENTVDGLIKGIQNGSLPPAIVRQLARDAYANLRAAKDARAEVYSAPSDEKTATPSAHKVADVVEVNGQRVKITSIDEKTGKATGEVIP